MPVKMIVSIYDGIHHQNAEPIKYDLWKINDNTNLVNIKRDIIIENNPHVLLEASAQEELGSFELVLYVKDYFQRFDSNIDMKENRLPIRFGINQLDHDEQLNVRLTPNGYTCTL